MSALTRVLAVVGRDGLAVVGIVGLAVNLIGSLSPFLTLARFARFIVDNWIELTSYLWVEVFRFLHIEIPSILGFALTLLVFHFGLVASSIRYPWSVIAPATDETTQSVKRERVIALLLYLPIMIGSLSTAFGHLSQKLVTSELPADQPMFVLSFAIVLLSPVLTFIVARPRLLMRRFLAVYMVAAIVLCLDWLARTLDSTPLEKAVDGL
ncbi:hypothetical protein ABAC402_18680 [Asticcacaulis sp. AC402]|nr:hypothetical protein ABAC402_18680 [Asticcacaulis sp. AC402]